MIDLSKAKLPQNYSEMSQVEKVHAIIPVARPSKTVFFQVNPDPDFSFEAYIFDYERRIYLVFPEVAAQFPELVKPVRIVSAITREGNPYLWPLRLPKDDGRSDNWAASAIEIAEIAKGAWVRVTHDMSAGCFIAFKAKGILVKPAFLAMTIEEMLQKAFRDFVITDMNHPIAREMLGDNTNESTAL
jgi:hypothetical protein